jgi:hypothetical protein
LGGCSEAASRWTEKFVICLLSCRHGLSCPHNRRDFLRQTEISEKITDSLNEEYPDTKKGPGDAPGAIGGFRSVMLVLVE